MGDVLVQHSPHIQQTTPRRQWHQGKHNIPEKAKGLVETLTAVISPHTWPRDPAKHKEDVFPSKLPMQQLDTFTKQTDQPRKPFEIPSPQHLQQTRDSAKRKEDVYRLSY